MFTGLIQDIGQIEAVESAGDRVLTIGVDKMTMSEVELGASIACNGICLTVTEKSAKSFKVQVSAETIGKTTAGEWVMGARINLERSLRAGDELGGHLVYGHIDGVAEIVEIKSEGDSLRMHLKAPENLAKFLAPKGSVTLDGVSLTVNDVVGSGFDINIIPQTQKWTNFGTHRTGQRVNLEIDILARYLDRLMAVRGQG
jgi:riboflavin synthase